MHRASTAATFGFLVLALSAVMTGCGGSSHSVSVTGPKLPVDAPGNTAPDSTVYRLLVSDQYLDAVDYDLLLAANYHYRFSAQADPLLVSVYGDGWDRAHETQFAAHLVRGFTNSSGDYVPPEKSFTWFAAGAVVSVDSTHSDSAAWYQVVKVPVLQLVIEIPDGTGGTLPYNISAPFVFHLVRGDAAVLLAGQSNAATRWYLAGIDDLSPPLVGSPSAGGRGSTEGTYAVTWGGLRSRYYN